MTARVSRGTGVLLAALVVAVAAAVTFGVLLVGRSDSARAQAEALATARAYAVTATSYNYQHIDADLAAVLDGATGEFKTEYGSATGQLRQMITQSKAVATGTVIAAGVQSHDGNQVVVVLLVDQSVTNAQSSVPTVAHNRIVMTLTPTEGRWLVNRMDLL